MKIVRAERPRGLGDACSEASAPEGDDGEASRRTARGLGPRARGAQE